jgi:hypothetical protein
MNDRRAEAAIEASQPYLLPHEVLARLPEAHLRHLASAGQAASTTRILAQFDMHALP